MDLNNLSGLPIVLPKDGTQLSIASSPIVPISAICSITSSRATNTTSITGRRVNSLSNKGKNQTESKTRRGKIFPSYCVVNSSQFIITRRLLPLFDKKDKLEFTESTTLSTGNIPLDWTGSFLGEVRDSDIREQFIDTYGNTCWTIQINQQVYTCIYRRITSIDPLFIDEMKRAFGLPYFGTHYVKYQKKFYLLFRPHFLNGAQMYDPKLRDFTITGNRFRKLMQYTIIFRYIFGLSMNCESSIRIRRSSNITYQNVQGLYGCGYQAFVPFQEPFDIFYPICGTEGRLFFCLSENMDKNCIPMTIWQKWFLDHGETMETVANEFFGFGSQNSFAIPQGGLSRNQEGLDIVGIFSQSEQTSGFNVIKIQDLIIKTFQRIDPSHKFIVYPNYYAENIIARMINFIPLDPKKQFVESFSGKDSAKKIGESEYYANFYDNFTQSQQIRTDSIVQIGLSQIEEGKTQAVERKKGKEGRGAIEE